MRNTPLLSSVLFALLILPAAHALQGEFNWVPSGTIRVGDRASEATAGYESVGQAQTFQLAYRDETPQTVTGRLVTGPESFVIRPAACRSGPAPAHLVICRRVDSANVPGPLRVFVGDREVGPWTIQPPAGERRLFDALFVISRASFPNGTPPAEVPVRITGNTPVLSLGYRFYATRDWDVLGDDLAGDIQAAAAKNTAVATYLKGLLAQADHDWSSAYELFDIRDEDHPALERLARVAMRRMRLRMARADALAADRAGTPDFDSHYRLGLLAGAWGCWEDALAEYRLAIRANPTHADATYRLAEAMEYNRLPIAQWAPLMERAGLLGQTPDCNTEDVLVAVHPQAIEGLCGELSQKTLEALQRNWRYVEQQVYGASRGAWKLRTQFMVRGVDDPPWVMQAGWIFLPPDETVPVEGTYDYSIGTAEYGSSHAGGVDCGVSGSGGAQIGPQRGWEVFLHEWNHEFDWVCVSAEEVPGYPVTHDSDGCGKQPIVNMGCGHRSSMRYYINRAQYRRHEGADPVNSDAFLGTWALGDVVAVPDTTATVGDALAKWLIEREHFTPAQLENLKRDWEQQRADAQRRAEKPPVVPAYPPPRPVPDWPAFLRRRWNNTKMLDQVTSPFEVNYVRGAQFPQPGKTAADASGDFVNLRKEFPGAPDKCVAYARTFIHAPRSQEVRLWLGYNDCAALWLNGRRIHAGHYYACAKWDDRNRPYMLAKHGVLQEGWNCLAVKVERGGGDWGFSVHVVDFDNRPIGGLEVRPDLPVGAACHHYTPPEAGPYYRWADVQEDYLERLPRLRDDDLTAITGLRGLHQAEHRFLLTLPTGTTPRPGSSYIPAADDDDTALNNYLNWDIEAAAALRYEKDGAEHDLLLIRPEYYEEFLTLLREVKAAWTRGLPPADRILGYLWLDEAGYRTTPNRPNTRRAVLVVDAALGDYPAEGLDLLAP